MNIREEVSRALVDEGITFEKVEVNRDGDLKGLPATEIKVTRRFGNTVRIHNIGFAHKNHMDAEHMAAVVVSKMRGAQ